MSQRSTDSYGDVFARVKSALVRGGFGEWSVYELGNDGFAVVAEIETIDGSGKPLPGSARWLADPPLSLSIGKILSRIGSADRERYRVIVLVYTTRSLYADPGKSADVVRPLPAIGPRTLAPAVERAVPAAPPSCFALVYEFKKLVAQAPYWLDEASSGIPGRQHVLFAGLWTDKELQP